jgi:hypothetical protein
MTPKELFTALQKLRELSAPISLAPSTGCFDRFHLHFKSPQAGHIGGFVIDLHKPLSWDEEALISGWVVKQIELAGYHREVSVRFFDELPRYGVTLFNTETSKEFYGRVFYDSELAATLDAYASVFGVAP